MDASEQPQRDLRRQYWWIALALSAIAGSVDGIGYLLLAHVFTSHMSGNTVTLTIGLASGNWAAAWRHFEPIVSFFAGVLLGLLAAGILLRRRVVRIFAFVSGMEVVFLAAFLLLAHPVRQWMVICPAAAMGIQNALLRRVGHRAVRTTFITGMLATTADNLASAIVAKFQGRDGAVKRFRDFARYAAIWICFAAGGILSAFIEMRVGARALLIPIGALLLLIAYDAFHPVTLYAALRLAGKRP